VSFNTHDLGASVRVRSAFRNISKKVADPETVRLSIKTPSGTVSTVTFDDLQEDDVTEIHKRTSGEIELTGEYFADLDANEAGTWFYRWFSEGELQAAAESRFEVRAAQAIEEV
jgi:hypothetical protein